MDDIIKKLLAGGVSNDIVEKLKAWLGNTFETELVTNWLKVAAEKVGIDPNNLPNIDFKNLKQATQELIGKDIDGDGKTGITEMIENIGEITKNKVWFFAKMKRFFGWK